MHPSDLYLDPEENETSIGCGGCLLVLSALGAVYIVTAAAISVVLFWPFAFAYAWQLLQPIVKSPWGRLVVTFMLLLVAIGLFAVRENLRRLYGAVEVLLGCAIIWFGLTPKPDTIAATLAVAGGIYIVVRGLDNYARGKELVDRKRAETRANLAGDDHNQPTTQP